MLSKRKLEAGANSKIWLTNCGPEQTGASALTEGMNAKSLYMRANDEVLSALARDLPYKPDEH